MSFFAFLKWISYGNALTVNYNKYWGSLYGLCNPCLIDYDFVLKYENVEDYKMVVENADLGEYSSALENSEKEKEPCKFRGENFMTELLKVYKDIPKEELNRLYEIYKFDFILFDYNFKAFL